MAVEGTQTTMEIVSDHILPNNPHIAAVNAVKLIASSECVIRPPVTHTRFEAVIIGVLSASVFSWSKLGLGMRKLPLSPSRPVQALQFFWYGSKGSPQTIFHMDGRQFHIYTSNKQGFFFASMVMVNKTNSYLVGDQKEKKEEQSPENATNDTTSRGGNGSLWGQQFHRSVPFKSET